MPEKWNFINWLKLPNIRRMHFYEFQLFSVLSFWKVDFSKKKKYLFVAFNVFRVLVSSENCSTSHSLSAINIECNS